MCEEWKPVVGYEGIYEASNLGNIRRIAPWADGRKTKVKGQLSLKRARYLRVSLCANSVEREHPVHRLIYEAFNGPIPHGKEINHKNGNHYDKHLENLEILTKSQNERHKHDVLKRVMAHGEGHHGAKLTNAEVLQMRSLRLTGWMLKDLAAKFGVSPTTVCEVTKGKLWKRAAAEATSVPTSPSHSE